MDLEGCPEQISDKVFQDVHSALPGRRRGGGDGEERGGLAGEGAGGALGFQLTSATFLRKRQVWGSFFALFLACK